MSRAERPSWWPKRVNEKPMSLLRVLDALHVIRRDGIDESTARFLVGCLSHALRTWQSPSTPYEAALYNLCLEAMNEAQAKPEVTRG